VRAMNLKKAGNLTALCVLLFVAGCNKGGDPTPVAIYPGEDVCETCRMLISDQRFAAECLMKKGRVKKFDDTICMVRYFDMAKTLGTDTRDDVRAYFVKDYDSKEWLNAQKAHFVKADVTTVMGYGMLAFGSEERAREFAQQYRGRLLSFDDIWEVFRQPNAEPEVTVKDNKMTPDVVSVKFGDLVEIRLNVEDDKEYRIAVKGYNDGSFPPASKGRPAFLRLNAVKPGSDFTFVDLETNAELGRFRVEGAHFQEEMKKR
jgi:copper chaperone NosL